MLLSTHLCSLKKEGVSGLNAGILLNPTAIWLKWRIAGVPTFRIPCFADRLPLLSLAASKADIDGLWLEFGVWRGESLNHLTALTGATVYGFDSFEGLPETWSPSLKRGAFSTHGVLPRTAQNARLVKGWFEATLPKFLEARPASPASFIHIDCDLYKSTRFVLLELRSRIHPGTVIVFDEYTGMMPDDEARAFREFVRLTGASYEYLGCSGQGSLAVKIV